MLGQGQAPTRRRAFGYRLLVRPISHEGVRVEEPEVRGNLVWGSTVIRYHGTPLTPIDAMLRSFKGRHAMVSFDHPEQLAEACETCQSIVLDNGAFSAWRRGEQHDFEGYIAWADKWLKHPAVDWCVIPD